MFEDGIEIVAGGIVAGGIEKVVGEIEIVVGGAPSPSFSEVLV